jgi:hypothetical protein
LVSWTHFGGIEILTGINAGHIRNQQGVFPSDTIFSKVEERFTKMYESIKKVNN